MDSEALYEFCLLKLLAFNFTRICCGAQQLDLASSQLLGSRFPKDLVYSSQTGLGPVPLQSPACLLAQYLLLQKLLLVLLLLLLLNCKCLIGC
jgi:hypothetical protein